MAPDFRPHAPGAPRQRRRLLRTESRQDRSDSASLESGSHVFADKPWIIASADLPKLADSPRPVRGARLIAYDIMTERFEITSILQRELVNAPDVFGAVQAV